MSRLQIKLRLVTDGTHGIGKAIAQVYAGKGAHVFLANIDDAAGEKLATEIRRKGGDPTFIYCDVSSAEQIAADRGSTGSRLHF